MTISKRVYVGNLAFTTTRDALVDFFQEAGNIVDAHLPSDRETGKPRGFAFIEFENEGEAQKAIEVFEGKELEGRALRVNLAEERRPRAPGGGGGGGGGGRGPSNFSGFNDMPPPDDRGFKNKGSRRGARGRKRSLR